MKGWQCPVCGKVWAPSVEFCRENHDDQRAVGVPSPYPPSGGLTSGLTLGPIVTSVDMTGWAYQTTNAPGTPMAHWVFGASTQPWTNKP